MPETNATPETTPQPAPLPTFMEALRNPTLLAARRGELVQLASDRATKLAADARTRLQTARTGAVARAQDLRKASDAFVANALGRIQKSRLAVPLRVRSLAHVQLERAARALQDLANRVEPPCQQAPAEPATKQNGVSA
jgi:hypothetical protein